MKFLVFLVLLLGAALLPLAALQDGGAGLNDEEMLLFTRALQRGFPRYGGEQSGLEGVIVSLEEVILPGEVLIEAGLQLTFLQYSRDLQVIGSGKTREEAMVDLAGYLTRLIGTEALSIPGLVAGPRIEHIGYNQVYIFSPDPIKRGGEEFIISEPGVSGVLRVRSLAYWRSRDEEHLQEVGKALPERDNPWHHYLPVDVIYADGPLKTGMSIAPMDRFGLSLSFRGGYRYPSTVLADIDAVFDTLFDAWQPLIRISVGMDVSGGTSCLTILGGWKFPVYPRWGVIEDRGILHRLAASGSFTAGWDVMSGKIASSVSADLRYFLSSRYAVDFSGGLDARALPGETLVFTPKGGIGVTYRL